MNNIKYYNLPNTPASLVIGKAGSGKSHCYIGQILKNLEDESCIAVDSRGELYEKYRESLENRGYSVKYLSIDSDTSYNPFDYVNTEYDCAQLAHTFIESTSKKEEDKFFKGTTESLLTALISYVLIKFKGTDRCNFSEVIRLCCMMKDNFDDIRDKFEDLRKKDSGCLAVKRFDDFCFTCKEKTLDMIITELGIKLSVLNVPAIIKMFATSDNGINIKDLLDTKTVVFLNVQLNDTTYDFINNIFLTQILDMLNDNSPKKLRIILDEFQRLNLSFSNQMLLQICSIIDKYEYTDNFRIDFCIQSIAQLGIGAVRNLIIQRCKAIICLGAISKDDCDFFRELANIDVKILPIKELWVVEKSGTEITKKKFNKICDF